MKEIILDMLAKIARVPQNPRYVDLLWDTYFQRLIPAILAETPISLEELEQAIEYDFIDLADAVIDLARFLTEPDLGRFLGGLVALKMS